MQKQKNKQKIKNFEIYLCKQQSKQTQAILKQIINKDPHLYEQYLYILMSKNRLDLISYLISQQKADKKNTIKIINYLCKNIVEFAAQEVSLIWKQLYIIFDHQDRHRYQIFYECLSSFCFGGGNRKAQSNCLIIIMNLIKVLHQRIDNKILFEIINDFATNFLKFNLLELNYIKTMNTILELKDINITLDLYFLINKYLYYIELTTKTKLFDIKAQILKGIALLGTHILSANYLIGSIHNEVLQRIQELVESNIFSIRSEGRNAMRIWNMVKKRYQQQKLQKGEIQEQKNNIQEQYLIQEKLKQTQYQSKIQNIIQKTNKYALYKEFAEKKADSQFENINLAKQKQFLKKKTGNGGGYFSTQQNFKYSKPLHHKYQQILNNLDKIQPSNRGSYYIENDEYENSSHLSSKYQLENTIQYPQSQLSQQLQLLEKIYKKSKKNEYNKLSIEQIEKLIDLAYESQKPKKFV